MVQSQRMIAKGKTGDNSLRGRAYIEWTFIRKQGKEMAQELKEVQNTDLSNAMKRGCAGNTP